MPNILHFLGNSYLIFYRRLLNKLQEAYIKIPSNLTIIHVATDLLKSWVAKLVSGSQVINAAKYILPFAKWDMRFKISAISKALQEVKTDYCLILDSYDTTILSLKSIIDNFLTFNTKIVFNASANRYPDIKIDELPNRNSLGTFKYLNAGCCIGYTEALLEFYKKVESFSNIDNHWKSELLVVRTVYKDYATVTNEDNTFIKIDSDSLIFMTMIGREIIRCGDKYMIYTSDYSKLECEL